MYGIVTLTLFQIDERLLTLQYRACVEFPNMGISQIVPDLTKMERVLLKNVFIAFQQIVTKEEIEINMIRGMKLVSISLVSKV